MIMKSSISTQIYANKSRSFDWAEGKGLKIYNLGCGNQRYPGVVGMDSLSSKAADVVWDLNVFPWPIESKSVDIVLGFQVFEHLDNLMLVMEEIHRILKPGGKVIVEVPYFRHVGAFQDPTHKHFFTATTMLYFCKTKKRGPVYTDFNFVQKHFYYGWPSSSSWFVRLFKKFISKYQKYYDLYLSYIIPVPIVVYELEACE